jgi:hypothetical protein
MKIIISKTEAGVLSIFIGSIIGTALFYFILYLYKLLFSVMIS